MIEQTLRLAHRGNPRRELLVATIDRLLGQQTAALTWDMAWEWYCRDAGGESRHKAAHWRHLVRWLAANIPRVVGPHDVSREVAFAYADARRRSCSGKTWNNTRGTLHHIWTLLGRRMDLPNVWAATPTADGRGRTGRAFTAGETAAILHECQTGPWCADWYGASLVALYTGLRQGDIQRLRWDQVTATEIRLTPGKTARHRTRVVIPLHPILCTFFAARPCTGELVFEVLHQLLRTGRRQTEYPQIIAAAGVQDERHLLTFHCWRHTFRTMLAEAGVSAEVARQLGGWRSDIDERRYNHDLTQAAAAIARLPGVAGQVAAAGGAEG